MALAWQTLPFEALLRLVQRAEALGYAAVFVDGDISQLGGDAPRAALDGWTVTTALLARTTRIAIGSIRLVHQWNAARLAQACATAAHLFPGRFRLLVSIGGHPVDRAFGFPYPPVSERVRWLEESLEAARALWRGDRVTRHGHHVRLDGAFVRPLPPPGSLPIAIAARSPALLEVVAREGDLWDVNLPPIRRRVEDAAAALARACARAGRDAAAIERSMWIFTRVGASGPQAPAVRAEFRRLNPWFAGIRDDELGEGLVAGSATDCRARLEQIREELGIGLPIADLSGLPEGQVAAHLDALADP